MRITIKNIGLLKQAEFSLANLTILCGRNNTGKTYATYALYGFLSFWHDAYSLDIPAKDIQTLLDMGKLELSVETLQARVEKEIHKACLDYTSLLSHVLASSERHFTKSSFKIDLDPSDIQPVQPFSRTLKSGNTQVLTIEKPEGEDLFIVSLLVGKSDQEVRTAPVAEAISDALKSIFFRNILPVPFIASAERTGVAIFQKELNLSRNRLLDEIGASKKEVDPLEILRKSYADYPLPVKANINFTRQLDTIFDKKSFIAKEYPEILDQFVDIIGGSYGIAKDEELFYTPHKTRLKLTIRESSSAVRSLLDVGFYIRHYANKGDLFIIDEPELNLHPQNQRRLARLFAQLANIGIKVFMTTHSDYLIKELNLLIMLNQDNERLKKIAQREGYNALELLHHENVKVYSAEKALRKCDGASKRTLVNTLVLAPTDAENGIEIKSFDDAIADMNRLQDEIFWGGDA